MFEGVTNFIRVTWLRLGPFSEILFLHFGEIVHIHTHAKLQVSSFTGFGDMFEGVPNFIWVTWPRPRPFSEFLYVHFGEIVHVYQCAKFDVSSFSRFRDMFEGVPNFIGVTWLTYCFCRLRICFIDLYCSFLLLFVWWCSSVFTTVHAMMLLMFLFVCTRVSAALRGE